MIRECGRTDWNRTGQGGLCHALPSVSHRSGDDDRPAGGTVSLGGEREPDRYLIEDDYDSEFRYRGKPIPSLQSSDEKGKVIYIGTFSKAIAPAIRVSYMVLPETLLEMYRRDCSFYSCTVSRIDQRILNEFIRDGYFERHLNKMRMRYRAKHDQLLEGLAPFQKNSGSPGRMRAASAVDSERECHGKGTSGCRSGGKCEGLWDVREYGGIHMRTKRQCCWDSEVWMRRT